MANTALINQVQVHPDWQDAGPEGQEAVTLLVFGKFQNIIDEGLAIELPDNDMYDGLLDEALTAYDSFADKVGFEL